MIRCVGTAFVLVWVFAFVLPQNAAAKDLSELVGERLRNRIEAAGAPPKIAVRGELIHASVVLPLFYERRAYLPAWSNSGGLLPLVDSLIQSIREAELEGLRPGDYHLAKIDAALDEARQTGIDKAVFNTGNLVDLDLLLTDGFLIYGSHLLAGRINPETIDAEWFANRREADMAAVLQDALDSSRIRQTLSSLLPPQPEYYRLRQTLAHYRELAQRGGWQVVPEGPKLREGNRSERVRALRARLANTGDLDSTLHNSSDRFDDNLDQMVKMFQARHGLGTDGIVGPMTLGALNVRAEDRVRQIMVNMERMRWLPQNLGQRYIKVNIANFELDVVEDEQLVMVMKVVVGRDYRRTPVFSDKMTYLVFNPYWHVPWIIAVQDILPLVRKDSLYFANKNMKVYQSWGVERKEIDPKTVNWSEVTGSNFSFRFRQEPGPANALGRVKFMFPNQFNVYLHDTAARELFAKPERAFSSGCIRIEKPIELAEYVLRGDTIWTQQKILAAIDRKVEQTVRLPEPIPVHILYCTAWVNENGIVNFRSDIYGRDKLLDEALREEPPAP